MGNAFFTTMHSAAERDDCCDNDDLNDSQPESDDETPPDIKTLKTAIQSLEEYSTFFKITVTIQLHSLLLLIFKQKS